MTNKSAVPQDFTFFMEKGRKSIQAVSFRAKTVTGWKGSGTTQMKKAIVIGGGNGIGLAVCRELIKQNYYVVVVDRDEGDIGLLPAENYCFIYSNLLDFDEDLFASLASDKEAEVLIITAGIGRIADFSSYHIAEIRKTFQIDTVSVLEILSLFYPRIASKEHFYTGVMGSISGWMSSPAASVYAGAKAAVVRFIESVNIELEVSGTANRILDISPSSFKGSRFYGGKNDPELLAPLAKEIIGHIFARDTRFIPQYDELFHDILERYHDDPHAYGLHSYQYKKDSGRLDNSRKVIIGYLSGTFDLFHVGHLNLLKRAKEKCDYLIVGVHESGKWKGKETFIPFEERKGIVASCKYVDKVVDSVPEDSEAWEKWHFDRLFVGSDYKGSARFQRYEEYFKDKGVEIVYFPYTQSTSSTQIRKTVLMKTNDIDISNPGEQK